MNFPARQKTVAFLTTCALAATLVLLPLGVARATGFFSDLDGKRRTGAPPLGVRMQRLDLAGARAALGTAPSARSAAPPLALVLPLPAGGSQSFHVRSSPIMAPALAARFPEIRTYAGTGVDDPSETVRLDLTPHGFHAIVFAHAGTVYIDPDADFGTSARAANLYRIYLARDASVAQPGDVERTCSFAEELARTPAELLPRTPTGARVPSGTQLREYRLAVAATGEYTAFHGGTVSLGLAAIVTAMNRVNGIYEREVAVRLTLVSNNDLIVYTNSATDPYTNSNGTAMLGENQTNVDAVIGTSQYDIGHVFGTGGGGIASLGVPCRGSLKARGVTGTASPIGDPFYVDYIAHEMGHQFGANHTFNGTTGNCSGTNRNGPTAYEPGSGTTIMAYAGICSPQNLASHSDDYFHSVSFDEIRDYTQLGTGNVCPVTTATGNAAPAVDAGAGGFTIPIGTPFTLTGSATDPNGDSLVHRWEEFDHGIAGAPDSPSGSAPLFRSFPAALSPARTFPQPSDLVNNIHTLGELLPSYTRSLSFRLTALDNRLGGGGVDYDQMTFAVTASAGPFLVTEPNTAIMQAGLDTLEVTWNVANTTAAPVSCPHVDIRFSEDGGETFPTALAVATPNDGSHNVVVPDVDTSEARIKVACSSNVFFDISNVDFTVTQTVGQTFTVSAAPAIGSVCAGGARDFAVDLASQNGFSEPVTLSLSGVPPLATGEFSSNPVLPTGGSTLTLATTDAVASTTYPLEIHAVSGAISKSTDVDLVVESAAPARPTTLAPVPGATSIAVSPALSWTASPGASLYTLEIATDSAFTTIVYAANEATTSHAVASPLLPGTGYFWRVLANNGCGPSLQANASFVTVPELLSCASPAIAIPDGTGVPLIENAGVSVPGTIVDLDVHLDITHGFVGDLQATLQHVGTGQIVALLNRPGLPGLNPQLGCPNNDIDAILDDEATLAAENACNVAPPAISGSLYPSVPLSGFDGLDSATTFKLTVGDLVASDAGTLDTWCLDFTYATPAVGDSDGDGVPDLIDNCPGAANADQADPFGDGAGGPCDGDLDLDGLPNDWEAVFGLDATDGSDAALDADGDGLSNLEEHALGSDPTDPNSPNPGGSLPALSPFATLALAGVLVTAGSLASAHRTRRQRRER